MADPTNDNKAAQGCGSVILLCLLGLAWYNWDSISGFLNERVEKPRAQKAAADLSASISLTQYQCTWQLRQDLYPVVTLTVKNLSSTSDGFDFMVRFFDAKGRLVDDPSRVVKIPHGVERGPIEISSDKGFMQSSGLSNEALRTALTSTADSNHPTHWRAELLARDIGSFGDYFSIRTTPIDMPRSSAVPQASAVAPAPPHPPDADKAGGQFAPDLLLAILQGRIPPSKFDSPDVVFQNVPWVTRGGMNHAPFEVRLDTLRVLSSHVGTAIFKGRRIPAALITVSLVSEDRQAGVRETVCTAFGALYDPDFGVFRNVYVALLSKIDP